MVYGGAEMSYQVSELRSGCELLVATPGRLADMMGRGIVSLQHVKYEGPALTLALRLARS